MPRRRRQRGGDDDDDDDEAPPPDYQESFLEESVNMTDEEKETIRKVHKDREKAETRKRIEATRDEWLSKHKYNSYHEYVGYINNEYKPLCIDTNREQCYKGDNPDDERDVPWKQDASKIPADLPQGGNKRKSKKRKSRKQRKSKKAKRKSKGRRL